MASNEEGKISLKYWVDDKKERVIVAEASGELVDVLFSFLTLPLGTIIRLWDTSEQQQRRENTSEQQEGPGCINNLCPSFKDILGLRNNSQQQVGRENISEQLVGRGNTSEEQEGRDNNSEQQQRPDNSSEQQEGLENSSQQQQGHENTSEQQQRRENTSQQQQVEHENNSEQQQRRENTSEQQIGHENNSEQQEGPGCINKLCHNFKDILGLRSKQQVGLGCIKELYQSVNKLDSDVFRNNNCQEMLHSPRNPLESSCQRLKVKVDDTKPTKYFMCHNCLKEGSKLLVSSLSDVKCDCGSLMRKEIEMLEEHGGDDGVFVKGKAMFLIYDDLTVRRSSPSESIKSPIKLGHKKLENQIEEELDRKKILNILKQALTSKTPLSDVLLGKESKRSVSFSRVIGSSGSKDYLEIKVMVSKAKNKILFVEADGDFVDFLASFLTTPLGSIMNLKSNNFSFCLIPLLASILKIKNGKLPLGCIRNLYKSVKNLDPSWFIKSSNRSLLNPKVAPHFGCERNPLLNANQDDTAKYWCGLREMKNEKGRIISKKRMISKKRDMLQQPKDIKLLDPRSSDRARKDGVGFMKRPCLFVVNDDLTVLPMTTTSSISCSFMDDTPFTKLEEHLVKIKKSEAINLLRASLTSDKGAFTGSLSSLLWTWRFQRLIPGWSLFRRKRIKWEEKRKRQKREKDIDLNDKKEKKKQEKSVVESKREKEENNNNSVQNTKEEVKPKSVGDK
ncbi:uncharacterized protein LOC114166540 [Vigna unguiculata]|uniref:uncharacterized protein LOC114166540 n=1 Tax=Vigna unguiculata TaxID=3917 RepID=UPI001016B430|nr:uncharacterized protein LOC114166540 [Vigna unguiculata]